MDADLDLLLTAVYVTADDLLPEKPKNARRSVTDAEVVTLCVAQAIMGIPSDRRFLAVASRHLRHLFPKLPAQPDEREVALGLLARAHRQGGEAVTGDKCYAGRDFARAVGELDATIVRPRRKDEPGRGPHLAPIRQRIESIFWTCKDLLTLRAPPRRTLPAITERVLQRFLCLAAAATLNHQLGRPSRALVNYCA